MNPAGRLTLSEGVPMSERYILQLRPLPGDVPVMIRLRHVLKNLLRQHGFRCLSCVRRDADGTGRRDPGGRPSDPAGIAAAIAERASDLSAVLSYGPLPADVADALAGRLASLAAELEKAADDAAEALPV